jgi:RNA polymerase sigma-B factor
MAGRRDLCQGRGPGRHVYRAIDQFGQVLDVFVSPRRDAAAARRFFQHAIGTMRVAPVEVVTDHDPDYGTPFVPYAVACVVGELKRHLRDTSWRLHVPRPLKEWALRLCRAADDLHQRLGRSPTVTELAECLDVGKDEVLEGLAAASSRQEVSLDQPVGDADLQLGDLLPAPGAKEEPEDLLALPDLVSVLPELERKVIVLRFFHDLDQYEIAARIGFSQMHVSRLQRRAPARMRAQLVEP